MSADPGSVPHGYRFIRVLGAGGFGEVVLARHVTLNRLVAVKRIHNVALADTANVERFRREARLLATLDCTSVVRVYDLIIGERQAHLVMEYVPGLPLSDLVRGGPLPAARALPVLHDVAAALRAAAEHGIVHRDVKPHNVFVLPSGRAKLGDFGLARAVSDPDIFRTNVGTTLGTPAYFPPELGRGDGEPDERSDAYSFAVLSYETLTGRRPYEADDAIALIAAHWLQEPPDPRTLLPGLPDRAAAALLRGLDKEPQRRTLPAALVRQLESVSPHDWPEVAWHRPEQGAWERAAPTVRVPAVDVENLAPPRRQGRPARARSVPAAMGLLAALTAGGATGWWLTQREDAAKEELSIASIRLTTQPGPARLSCPDGQLRLLAEFMTNGVAGSFTIRWTGPDGSTLAERTLQAETGVRLVEAGLEVSFTGTRTVRGDVTVTVPDGEALARVPVVYRCRES